MAKCLIIVATCLALLVPSAALGLDKHPHGKKRKGAGAMLLEKMNSFIETRGQVGLHPAERQEVWEIRTLLATDIIPAMVQAAQSAQQHIDELYQTLLDCQVEVVTGLTINRDLWEDTVTKQKNATECFDTEVLIIDEEVKVCKDYEEVRTVLELPAIPPPDKTDNLEAYNYLKTMSEYFCGIEKVYVHKWEECKMKKQNHTETWRICKDIAVDYEEAICGWHAELEETCTEYMGCWNKSLHAYHDYISKITDLEEDWKSEADSVQKLDCLWEAWNYSSDPCVVNITMVEVCTERPINYSNVTITTYEPPEPRTCPPDPAEPGQDNAELPCSSGFMNVAFGYLGLPQSEIELIKQDCRECPH